MSTAERIGAFMGLIRWPNLLMMSSALLLIRFGFFVPLDIPVVLDHFHFILLVFSTACIGAAGYVVNDLYDIDNDRVNKPDRMRIGTIFSEQFGWNAFIAFFLIGGGLGWYLGQHIGKPLYGAINLITGFWLYLYAADFKGRPLLGNIMISFLSAGVLTYPLFFDVLPRLPISAYDPGRPALLILSVYFCFAFVISLVREIVKDMEDVQGDRKTGLHTIPLVWGMGTARVISIFLTTVLLLAFITAAILGWTDDMRTSIYVLSALATPCLLALLALFKAKERQQFHRVSFLLKMTMAAAIFSFPVFTFFALA